MRIRRKVGVVEQPKEAVSLMSDAALMVAAGTAMTYAVAFSFEVGYCRHFNIPYFLIVPTASVILFALFGVIGVSLSLAQLLSIERALLSVTSLPPLFRTRLESSLLFALAGLASFGFSWSAVGAAVFGLFVWCGVYIPAFFFPRRGTLSERLREVELERDHLAESSPLVGIFDYLGERGSQLALFTLVACFVASGVGAATARLQKEYHVLASRPDVALVKSYGDVMVGIKFDETKKAATGEVVLFKVDDDFAQVNLNTRRIGPLDGVKRSFLELGGAP